MRLETEQITINTNVRCKDKINHTDYLNEPYRFGLRDFSE